LDAIVAQLLAGPVAPATYPPEVVLRCFAPNESWTPEPTHAQMYYVWHEAADTRLGPQSCEKTTGLQVAVRAYKRLNLASENPITENPKRSEYQFELETDVVESIYRDHTFGNTAVRVRDSIVSDYTVQEPSYAAVDVRFVVEIATNRPGR
jgi:hypothetical protein